ncbi:MAG: ABC transporter substrate-binding protein [Campylobacterota bacterium]|nr:ABC transporter substrate-binding protein [Campylobacterota bacterium]
MKFVWSLLLFLLFSNLLVAKELQEVTLQLKWFHSFQFAGYYMAKEKGFYEEEGLDVELLERDPSKNNIEQVLSGEAEYGVADSTLLL